MSDTAMAIIISIHLMAIVTWLGLIVSSAFVFFPSLGRLAADARANALATYRKNAIIVSTVAVLVLATAGTILTAAEPHPEATGGLFPDQWTTLIVIKHLLIGAILLFQMLALFGVQPRLIKALKESGDAPTPEEAKRIKIMTRRNQGLALLSTLAGFGVLAIISFVVTFY